MFALFYVAALFMIQHHLKEANAGSYRKKNVPERTILTATQHWKLAFPWFGLVKPLHKSPDRSPWHFHNSRYCLAN